MFDLDKYLAADDNGRRAMMQTTTPREFTNAIANEPPARKRELMLAAMSAVAPMIGGARG